MPVLGLACGGQQPLACGGQQPLACGGQQPGELSIAGKCLFQDSLP